MVSESRERLKPAARSVTDSGRLFTVKSVLSERIYEETTVLLCGGVVTRMRYFHLGEISVGSTTMSCPKKTGEIISPVLIWVLERTVTGVPQAIGISVELQSDPPPPAPTEGLLDGRIVLYFVHRGCVYDLETKKLTSMLMK